MPRLTAEEAVERLGIHRDHEELFLALWELLRTPESRDAELEKLRGQMGRINQILSDSGFEEPQGPQGVADMAAHLVMLRDERQETERLKDEVIRLRQINHELGKELTSVNSTLKHYGVEKEGSKGLWAFAVLYEDARDKAAADDLAKIDAVLAERGCARKGLGGVEDLARHDMVLAEDVAETNSLLKRIGLGQHAGSRGVQDLVDRYQAIQDRWAWDHKDDQVPEGTFLPDLKASHLGMMHRAPRGTRYAKDTFENQVGKLIPVHGLDGRTTHMARIIKAEVSSDGSTVEFTLEKIVDGQ